MPASATEITPVRPWPALWALCLGFFMILIDVTIVSVAIPAIRAEFDADIAATIWVSSAYLLAFAVPLLITGRLGDRFGPKRVYLFGLVVFTLASLTCGFAGSLTALILARIAQGLGASLMNPQTMAIITRIFPAERRGVAMGMWGAVAGAATLAGPLLGGILVGTLGWKWIFFVNIPVGVLAFVMAWRWVPHLPRAARRIDLISVGLVFVSMFLIVFALQEGPRFNWGTIIGPITVPVLIVVGLAIFVLFVARQKGLGRNALLPLRLFQERNFSIAAFAISTMGLAMTCMFLPIMIYAQDGRGLTPIAAGLLVAPVAVFSGVLSPFVGRIIDQIDVRYMVVPSLALLSVATVWFGLVARADTPLWQLVAPLILIGVANAGIWSSLSTTATRNLTADVAGAGAGVYNTTRQTGAVLGTAAIAAVMEQRVRALSIDGASPDVVSAAMGQSLFLPAFVVLLGAISALFLRPVKK
ncbi:DHA2 family efflux MFS transporter permease subunit [Hoyosella rhizosphaerae]|uniref:MFS transporter n=1 Tax=Hoyosella rhizosphaerae TaxID=1755582 RepID=A0A916XA68_9ACTN|nr:DHA2 family efflux MFS transporter permease subunit [Hoyosella rhizosphaerae]GGC56741.1 MFS transporter [Hoyosella rhizosphaerae]